jgi:hypothetical protein
MQPLSALATGSVEARLVADHERLEAQLEAMFTAPVVAHPSLWAAFEVGLLAHLEDEESRLFPRLLEARPRDAYVLLQEHRHLRGRVAEIASALRDGVAVAPGLRDFRDELRAHAHTEGRLLYRWAGRNVSS